MGPYHKDGIGSKSPLSLNTNSLIFLQSVINNMYLVIKNFLKIISPSWSLEIPPFDLKIETKTLILVGGISKRKPVWGRLFISASPEVVTDHTGSTTYLTINSWNICLQLIMGLCANPNIFCSPSSVTGLSQRCLSHLEKRREPAGGRHAPRLWKHDVDQRTQELHLQGRWFVFRPFRDS